MNELVVTYDLQGCGGFYRPKPLIRDQKTGSSGFFGKSS